jgi:hypothetical protein
MSTVDLKDLQSAAKWIRETDARDATETADILGISRARLSQMMSDGQIIARKFDGRVWVPMSQIKKHMLKPGEIRTGRPRSGAGRKPARN